MVLLKNDGVLPLSGRESIAVIGEAARHPRIQGGGSSQITTTRLDSPLEELGRLAPGARISFAQGYDDADADRPDLIAEAASAAAASDVAVVFVGLSESRESEGRDRTDLDLAPQQVATITAVAEIQPRTVVVMFNGSAVLMTPWVDRVAGVLEAWYAGQAAGGAVADVLLGIAEPGGRLPETFPMRLEDTPAFLDFPGDGDSVRYGEGLFVGYRWYTSRRLPVAFPFGHGLSYTTFAYGEARASSEIVAPDHGTTISVDVTNTGQRAGSDVVQVYVRDRKASVARPDRELRGFGKVRLEPGQTTTVRIGLDARAFAFWDPRVGRWVVEPGTFDILVGRSAEDIVASFPVMVARGDSGGQLTDMSPLRDWLDDDVAGPAARAMMRRVGPILGSTFGADEDTRDVDPHFGSYFGAMPLRGLLEFAAGGGGPDPETELDLLKAATSGAMLEAAR
jgi:beta-glucosidase